MESHSKRLTDDAEVEYISAIDVGYRGLISLFEA